MDGSIVPAVLARSRTQLSREWNLASDLAQLIHLDVSDGTLVPGRTVSPKILRQVHRRTPVEIHCMSNRPDRWLEPMLHLNTKRVILHVELGRALKTYLAFVRSHHFRVVLALNPNTPLARLRPWVSQVDGVQVMGVHPGRQGAPWQAATITRIKTIHRHWPRLKVSCDGGMTPLTIPAVRIAGAQRFVVGSFLQNHPDPDSAWQELRRAAARK